MLIRTCAYALLILIMVTSRLVADVPLADGLYTPEKEGAVHLKLPDGTIEHGTLATQLNCSHAIVRSMRNDNATFQIDIVTPYTESAYQRRMIAVAGGIPFAIYYSRQADDSDDGIKTGQHWWYNQITVPVGDTTKVDAIAAALKTEAVKRVHPGQILQTIWEATEKSFEIGKPVTLRMTITNVGKVPVSFHDGGMQRGSRNNQFDFICRRSHGHGKAIPDIGDPNHFGGISQMRTISPGESFSKEIDITKWFQFEEAETYRVTGLFRMELQPTDSERWNVLWEELSVGECLVSIKAAASE